MNEEIRALFPASEKCEVELFVLPHLLPADPSIMKEIGNSVFPLSGEEEDFCYGGIAISFKL